MHKLLDGNYFEKEGTIAISEALKINQTLQKLDLGKIRNIIYIFIGNNKIRKEGAIVISEALKINQTLQKLNLCKIIYNQI